MRVSDAKKWKSLSHLKPLCSRCFPIDSRFRDKSQGEKPKMEINARESLVKTFYRGRRWGRSCGSVEVPSGRAIVTGMAGTAGREAEEEEFKILWILRESAPERRFSGVPAGFSLLHLRYLPAGGFPWTRKKKGKKKKERCNRSGRIPPGNDVDSAYKISLRSARPDPPSRPWILGPFCLRSERGSIALYVSYALPSVVSSVVRARGADFLRGRYTRGFSRPAHEFASSLPSFPRRKLRSFPWESAGPLEIPLSRERERRRWVRAGRWRGPWFLGQFLSVLGFTLAHPCTHNRERRVKDGGPRRTRCDVFDNGKGESRSN